MQKKTPNASLPQDRVLYGFAVSSFHNPKAKALDARKHLLKELPYMASFIKA